MTITTTWGLTVDRPAYAARVYTRQEWGDAWTERPHLECIRFSKRTAPSMGDATFLWRYGKIEHDDDAPTLVAPLTLRRHWVKVTLETHTGDDVTWYGLVVKTSDQRCGLQSLGRTGNQTIHAVSLEWLMTRNPIQTARVVSEVDGTFKTISRGLAFNAGRGDRAALSANSFGNRSAAEDVTGIYGFQWPGSLWTAAQMVDYLLYHHQPIDDGVTFLAVELTATSRAMLATYKPNNVEIHGKTLYQALNQIIDRRSGYTWSLRMETTGANAEELMYVDVHTYNSAAITLPSGGTLAANPETHNWVCDNDREIEDAVIDIDSSETFESICVEGSRRGVCFTARYDNATLLEGWSSPEEGAYTGAGGGAGADIEEKRRIADSARQQAVMEKVFTWHIVSSHLSNGILDSQILCPLVNRLGTDTGTALPFYYDGATIQPKIPVPSQAYEEWPPIFAAAPIVDGRWENLSKLGHLDSAEGEKRQAVNFSCDVIPLTDQPGVKVVPSHLPHVMGKTTFESFQATSDTFPRIDYETILITVFLECDDFVKAYHPESPAVVNSQTSELLASVGTRARLDRVIEDTVTDVVDGNLVEAATTTYIRDDRSWMRDLARLLWEYHGRDRKSLHVKLKQLTGSVPLGALITDFGAGAAIETIQGVVSELEWQTREQTTQVKTSFGEFDVLRLAEELMPQESESSFFSPGTADGPFIPSNLA